MIVDQDGDYAETIPRQSHENPAFSLDFGSGLIDKPMPLRAAISITVLLLAHLVAVAAGTGTTEADIERRFQTTVLPFIGNYCISCHDNEKPKGDFDLSPYHDVKTVARDHAQWELVLEKLQTGEMPPKKAKQHPASEQSQSIIAWIQELRINEAEKNAGDPGAVLARRLSNAEYDYSIRDLTGVDLRPTREFPIDPANQEGFDNSGESLAMSPALLKKYLHAARQVADNVVFKPDGIAFAPHPMLADTDHDKYCVLRIVDFYKQQPTDLAAYFEAAWRYKYRGILGQRRVTLAEVAAQTKVSPKYLDLIWITLNDSKEKVGPIAKLQSMWRDLPVPDKNQSEAPQARCADMKEFVLKLRQQLVPDVPNMTAPGVHDGSQCFVLWKDRQFVTNRRRFDTNVLQVQGVFQEETNTIATNASTSGRPSKKRKEKKKPSADADLTIPANTAERTQFEEAFARFCSVFPDAFYVSERARVYLDAEGEKDNGGRLLSAGFHSMTGYFRDDAPLCDMILDEPHRRELDRLWTEFEVIASVPQRMHTSFIWFERTDSRFMIDAEFDFARAEDKDSTSEVKIRQLADVYYAKAKRLGATEPALVAIREHFENVSASIRRVDKIRQESEPRHLDALESFAERAYRRPLLVSEKEDLRGFYRSLRTKDGLSHEDAIRDSVVSVLMSPHFCYRFDLLEVAGKVKQVPTSKSKRVSATVMDRAQPLSDYALASRLSYFLWSSPPDDILLAHAAAGDLHHPEVMAAETRRMMQDDRIRNLALEFGGHWLDFRRFEEHNAVDRERFPTFNDPLRQAMFEEPVRLFLNIVKENRPVSEFLDADYTFVNPALAKHYGFAISAVASNQWVRVDDVQRLGRGGLLPMSVFLTANSPGLRTSPVKRGYWVARKVLGEHIPPPPATVPELPADEAKLGELTLRETLAKHRADPTCASCHQRFDSLGLVFEGFGPIGELRTNDLGGRPVDTHAVFPGGAEGSGLDGLRAYIKSHREQDFVDNLSRKLLAYALGRSLILSDDITLRDMRVKLKANGQKFGVLVESIVTSPQFMNKRGPKTVASR